MQRNVFAIGLQHPSHSVALPSHESRSNGPNLTRRQQQIAHLLSTTGLSYKQVAARLDISDGTMRKHTEQVYRRMGVHSRAELMIALSQASANT